MLTLVRILLVTIVVINIKIILVMRTNRITATCVIADKDIVAGSCNRCTDKKISNNRSRVKIA